MTSDKRFEVLSALIDREPLDPDQLRVALDDPAGRAQLVDFVRLRSYVQQEFPADDHAAPVPRQMPARRRLTRAALVLLTLSAGFVGGAWWSEQRDQRPPRPDKVIQFVAGVDWK
jgi:hypothetical protein